MRSCFLGGEDNRHFGGEHRYYIVYGAMLCLCALLLLMMSIFSARAVTTFLASWLLFIALIMSILRTMAYRRGLADFAMGLIAALFYGIIGWTAGGTDLYGIEIYRYMLCAVLLCLGLSRLLVFARLINIVPMPMLIFCFAADIVGAALLAMGYPEGKEAMIYWLTGMLVLIDGMEQLMEASLLKKVVRERRFDAPH